MFKGPDTDINLHAFSAGCPEVDRMLIFRDWLRVNPADRQGTLERNQLWLRRNGRSFSTTPMLRMRL